MYLTVKNDQKKSGTAFATIWFGVTVLAFALSSILLSAVFMQPINMSYSFFNFNLRVTNFGTENGIRKNKAK